MSDAIVITLYGAPQGKGRARHTRTGRVYTPKKTALYEKALALLARQVMAGRPPLTGPVSVRLWAYMPVPKSATKKFRAAALAGEIAHTKKPDKDNIEKTLDALNGIVWNDDSQIVLGLQEKLYSDNPRLVIRVTGHTRHPDIDKQFLGDTYET